MTRTISRKYLMMNWNCQSRSKEVFSTRPMIWLVQDVAVFVWKVGSRIFMWDYTCSIHMCICVLPRQDIHGSATYARTPIGGIDRSHPWPERGCSQVRSHAGNDRKSYIFSFKERRYFLGLNLPCRPSSQSWL